MSRYSHSDLQDYYDDIPPPHRLSTNNLSSPDIPLASASDPRGIYTPMSNEPGAANAAGRPAQYRPITYEPPSDAWLEKQDASRKRTKYIIMGSLLAVAIIIAVVVGVVVSKNKKNSTSALSSGSPSGGSGSSSDPSKFQKDSRLIRSLWGMAYTPEGSILPSCGANLNQVITDVQLISQLTPRIRLYGADCNISALVLEAIKQTKVDLGVYLANFPNINDNGTAYRRQRDIIKDAISTYGTDHILGVTVGNEFMLNYLNSNGGGDNPNGPVGQKGAQQLISYIQDTRSTLSQMGLGGKIPVGNSDAGAYFNTQVLEAVDYGMANVHAWFANVSISQAGAWTWDFFTSQNVQPAALLSNKPQMYIAETGWPANSSDVSNESNGPSNASLANLQNFLDTFVCQANTNSTPYFYFEYFDETWKDITFGGVEGWWGLFHANRTLKNLKMPNCPL